MKKGFCSQMGLGKAELTELDNFFSYKKPMVFSMYCDCQRQGYRTWHFPNRFDSGKLLSGFPLKLSKL